MNPDQEKLTRDHAVGDPFAVVVLAPKDVRQFKSLRFPGDTDKELERRNVIFDAVLDVAGR